MVAFICFFQYVFMAMDFNVIIEKGEDGYLVSEVVELPGCHTQAKSIDELLKRTKQAISLYLKCGGGVKVKDKFLGMREAICFSSILTAGQQ